VSDSGYEGYDAIIVPGGGVREGGIVPPWVKNRLDRAIEFHQQDYIIALSAGTTHKPPLLDAAGFPIFEAVAGARYLVEHGVEPEKILCETTSYDTMGNAYFSRVIHVEPRLFKQLLIITSHFHMPRTKAIFQWIYSLSQAGMDSPIYQLSFEAVPDVNDDLDGTVIQARAEKEERGLERVFMLQEKIRTLEDFHRWLFTRHGAYAVATPPVRLSGSILSTY